MSTHNAINWAIQATQTMTLLARDEDACTEINKYKPAKPFKEQRREAAEELKLAYFFLTGESIS